MKMNLLKHLSGLLLLLCCCSSTLSAQQKIAYVDTDEVLTSMPAYAQTKKDLEAFQKARVYEIEQDKKMIAKYYKEVIEQMQSDLISPKQQQEAEEKLQKMQADLERKTNEADQQLLKKEEALTKPLYAEFEAALKAVAQKNNYTYILDKKMTLFTSRGIDATEQMKKQLGL